MVNYKSTTNCDSKEEEHISSQADISQHIAWQGLIEILMQEATEGWNVQDYVCLVTEAELKGNLIFRIAAGCDHVALKLLFRAIFILNNVFSCT